LICSSRHIQSFLFDSGLKVKDDKSVVVSILREPKAGVALEFASERLRKDKTVVLTAVSKPEPN